jgi:hypothetical protein
LALVVQLHLVHVEVQPVAAATATAGFRRRCEEGAGGRGDRRGCQYDGEGLHGRVPFVLSFLLVGAIWMECPVRAVPGGTSRNFFDLDDWRVAERRR